MLGLYALIAAFGAYVGHGMTIAAMGAGMEQFGVLFGALILGTILLVTAVTAVIAAAWPGRRGRPAARRLLVGDLCLVSGAGIGWAAASILGSA